MDDKKLELSGSRTIPWKDDLPTGLTAHEVVFGRDDSDVGEVQIAIAAAAAKPTKGQLDIAWRTRGVNTAMPVLVAAVHTDGVWLYDGKESPLGPISIGQAQRRLQAVLDDQNGIAAQQTIRAIQQAYSSIGAGGYVNQFLFASYYLEKDVKRRQDWATSCESAEPLLEKRGKDLITDLGFVAESLSNSNSSTLVLRAASGSRRAVAVLLDESELFDQKSPAYQLSPVAHGLEVAGREEVPWLMVLRQSALRLYPGRDGVGVGQRGQSETYFELDLSFVDSDDAGLLSLIFSAAALERGGSAEEILEGSGRYAADLGGRLRDRVYDNVVPQIAIAIAERLPELGLTKDADGVKVAYSLTLRVLFRLLFQAYGEDSALLPAGRNSHYDANSLQAFVEREMTTAPEDFSESASSIWFDLVQVWDAIFSGNPRWEVPAYGGSIFDPTTVEGALLKKLQLPDSVLGPALQAMLTEVTGDGVPGPVDFRSLQVREFGTIYEGLLESSLSLAESDLTLDRAGVYVPAKEGESISAAAGAPYFHSASGERKATGSYFTPKIVVDHLIERSVAPALEAHLGRVRELVESGKHREAASTFWDFRVADLAMGSAHFLVAAVDKVERGMRDFLTVTSVPEVRAELARLAEKAREALGDDLEAAEAITEAQLLRRQVARRCAYGLDINPLAVELSRLAIWIHTFVPGLPMSSLDHTLVLGNSLTGIGSVDDAIDTLAVGELLAPLILEPLSAARELLVDFANASEADRSEVAKGIEVLSRAREAAAPAKAVFDVAVAMRLGVIKPGSAFAQADIDELSLAQNVSEAVEHVSPAHLPYLFPEVFLRPNPGFDALIGNPPWEKLHVEEHQWWGLRIPRLRSMPQAQRKAALKTFQDARPDLMTEYRAAIDSTKAINKAVAAGPFPGIGAAHLDLFSAFAWRNWQLLRSGGLAALVLPRGALAGSGLSQWRNAVLTEGGFESVTFLVNAGGWVFENVHNSYTVGLTVLSRTNDHVVRFAGPFSSEQEFRAGESALTEVPAEEFLSWSSTAAFPLIPQQKSVEVFRQMKRSPRFDLPRPQWEFRPLQGDLNATSESKWLQFDVDESRGRIPVVTGGSFNIWNPNFGGPKAYGEPGVLRKHLTEKYARSARLSRSVYNGLKLVDEKLPLDSARIAFRDITRATDSRTVLTCLLPPGTAAMEKAPVIVQRQGGARAAAALLGVLSSIPFDWYMRRWIELKLSFELLSPSPIPEIDLSDSRGARVVEVSGRLAAVDDRYVDWAAEVGVNVGSVEDSATKTDLIAELDALVSLLYGLTEKQVEHIFATFHRGWDYQPRLAAVLEHYANWKEN